MLSILLSSLISIVTRLVTSEFIQFLILEGAKALAKKTDNKYDDEIVTKMEEVLGKSNKESK